MKRVSGAGSIGGTSIEPVTKTVALQVKSRRSCYDHFLGNNEPNTERLTFEVDGLDCPNVSRLDYFYHWRDWVRPREATIGFENYARMDTIQVGDKLSVTYLVERDVWGGWKDPAEPPVALGVREGDYSWPADSDVPCVLSPERERYELELIRLKNCNDFLPSANRCIMTLQNVTQGWRIESFVLDV